MRFGSALALLALALKLLVPPGYMPGPSLSEPVMLCPDQGPAAPAAMAHGGHHQPVKAPHGQDEHPCAYAGLAAATLLADLDGSGAALVPALSPAPRGADRTAVAPGRGMAAPPPPSHAPPASAA